jgi:hypothetical protein
MKQAIQTVSMLFTVPWSAFVAGFLYYTLLALLALSGLSPSNAVVATAYLAPAVAYLVNVAGRIAAASSHAMQLARHAARLHHAGGQ